VFWQAVRDPDQRPGWRWSEMAKFWLDLVGIIIVLTIVFVLVALCERERH
jgi:hypothetical protein